MIYIYMVIYLLIGFISGMYIWHDICKSQTEEEKTSENSGAIVAIVSLVIFWPIGLTSFINDKIHKKL